MEERCTNLKSVGVLLSPSHKQVSWLTDPWLRHMSSDDLWQKKRLFYLSFNGSFFKTPNSPAKKTSATPKPHPPLSHPMLSPLLKTIVLFPFNANAVKSSTEWSLWLFHSAAPVKLLVPYSKYLVLGKSKSHCRSGTNTLLRQVAGEPLFCGHLIQITEI